MKRLSVIIPLYNVEPYIERCIRSLEKQNIPENEYEIICINDGSPDDSRGVVLKLKMEYSNIILIDQPNQGVSRARNNGINEAKGRFLLFMDPDDYCEINSFQQILEKTEEYNSDVTFLGFTFLKLDGTVRNRILNKSFTGRIYPGIEAYYLARSDGYTDPDRMVGVLFSTAFLNKNSLRYLPEVPYLEDGEFIARILCLAKCCIFNSQSFYYRTTRPGSATNSGLFLSERAKNGFLMAAINLKRFQNENDLSKECFNFLNQPICKFALLTLNTGIQNPILKNYRKIKKNLVVNNLNVLSLNGIVRPYIFYAYIFNCCKAAFLLNSYVKALKETIKKIMIKNKLIYVVQYHN